MKRVRSTSYARQVPEPGDGVLGEEFADTAGAASDLLLQWADAQVERFYDCVVATHGRATTLTALVPGVDGVTAAREALTVLTSAGITVERLVDDLVTRAEIATRVGVTPQAVGLWVRGERNRVGGEVPGPYVYAGGATLWLWGDVVEFLREIGATVDGSVYYPSRQETLQIAGLILDASAGRRVVAAG